MKALVLVLLTSACAVREAGIEVDVSLTVEPLPNAGPRLEGGLLSITGVRGVLCTEMMAALSPVSTAWAHGAHAHDDEASPLQADVRVDLDLLVAGTTPLATLRPPPGTWCALELQLSPSASTGATLVVVAGEANSTRRYLTRSERNIQLVVMPVMLSGTARSQHLTISLDPIALSTLQPASPDARLELLDTLVASLSMSSMKAPK
jgi:hypothetical protein